MASTTSRSTISRFTMPLLVLSSVVVALVSFRFLVLGLEPAFAGMIEHVRERRLAFLAHVIAAPLALAFGVMQFSPGLRARRPALHRWTGRFYVTMVVAGGMSGLALAFNTAGGPISNWGFGVLSVLWLGTTFQALRFAMKRQFTEHRRWMIYSFALTFAAVTLRLQLGFAIGVLQIDYATASMILAWSCWIPNLLFAQWWIARNPGLPMPVKSGTG